MKTLIIKSLLGIAILLTSHTAMGQTAELTIEIKGIKEAKGIILVMVKDCEDPQKLIYDKVEVKQEDNAILTLKELPIGKVDVSLFHDLNGNFKLDMDEQNIPIEPVYSKEKLKIKEGENKLVARLINVKEMMPQQP